MGNLYQDLQVIGNDQKIRLLTLRAGEYDHQIEIKLAVHSLDNCPEYLALSYCWGDSATQRAIRCNGYPFQVTRNLELALARLRSGVEDRILWIDAICIDQGNTEERSAQVGLMRDIYSSALGVVIWLGEEADASSLVFPALRHMMHTRAPWTHSHVLPVDWGQMQDGARKSHVRLLLDAAVERDHSWRSMFPYRYWGEAVPVSMHRWTNIWRESLLSVANDMDNIWNRFFGPSMLTYEYFQQSTTSFTTVIGEARADRSPSFGLSDGETRALLRLLERPWFRRCWVIQEVRLARNVAVMCGGDCIDWAIFSWGVCIGLLVENKLAERHWELLARACALRIMEPPPQRYEENLEELVGLLWRFRSFETSDPRDKVYSLLGLLSDRRVGRDEQMTISPDYTISVADCYLRTASTILKCTRSLDLLTTNRPPVNPLEIPLPSWAPDWSWHEGRDVNILPVVNDHGMIAKTHVRLFTASGTQRIYCPRFKDEKMLILSGFVTDTIGQVEAVAEWQDKTLRQLALSAGSSPMVVALYSWFWEHIALGQRDHVDTILQWEKLALANKRYPTGEEPINVLCATLYGGNMPQGKQMAFLTYQHWRYSLKRPGWTGVWRDIRAHGLRAICWCVFTVVMWLLGSSQDEKPFEMALELCKGRRLARTTKQYLGLVPRASAPGDSIALFRGGKMPFVIRPRGKQWELIGPCYIHGIMYGEAWKDFYCGDMEII